MKTTLALALAAAALTFGSAARADTGCPALDLVANCGFESGDFTGWTLSGTDVPFSEGPLYGVEGSDPYPTASGGTDPAGGAFQAYFLDQDANAITLSQSVATKAGAAYTVSFALAQFDVNDPFDTSFVNSLTASFGGKTLLALADTPDFAYKTYSFDVVATSGMSTFQLVIGDTTGEFLVDNVSVAADVPPVSSVPEPSTPLLAAAGLVALGAAARRKTR